MSNQTGNRFIIDIQTSAKLTVISRLKRLASTVSIEDGGTYREDSYYSQLHIVTLKSETELDKWLYDTKGIEYIGVIPATSDWRVAADKQ